VLPETNTIINFLIISFAILWVVKAVAAQVAALRAAGAGKVCREVASGAKTDRAQLRKATISKRAAR
jgi:large-conductance mechanosensitive channel